jgi:hypothetical protein
MHAAPNANRAYARDKLAVYVIYSPVTLSAISMPLASDATVSRAGADSSDAESRGYFLIGRRRVSTSVVTSRSNIEMLVGFRRP